MRVQQRVQRGSTGLLLRQEHPAVSDEQVGMGRIAWIEEMHLALGDANLAQGQPGGVGLVTIA